MPRRLFSLFFLVAALGLFSATRANADEVFTWTLPSSPTIPPANVETGVAFEIGGVQFSLNGISQGTGTFDFFNINDGGGFDLFTSTNPLLLNEFGPQLYSGPEDTPTFTPGTYTLMGEGSASAGLIGTLVITATAAGGDLFTYTLTSTVPEPSSLLLLGSGALGLLGFARRKIFS